MQVRGLNASRASFPVMPPATALKTASPDTNSAQLHSTPRRSRVHPPCRQPVCIDPGQSRAASHMSVDTMVCTHPLAEFEWRQSECACTWRLGLWAHSPSSTAAIMRTENLRMSIRTIINASDPISRPVCLPKPPSHASRALSAHSACF